MIVERSHDYLYLKENYKDNPKEYFKLVKGEIDKDFPERRFKMIDIGCETGSFLYFLRKAYQDAELVGFDIVPELLQKVEAELNVRTILGDISNKETYKDKFNDLKECDFITMLGVLSIFDDFRPIIHNALELIKEDGILYIFGIFNPENIDILIRSKNADKECNWERGWNYFSKYSIEKYCGEIGYAVEFIPFHIGIDIPKHENDALRSWTINLESGEKMIVNGLQLVHNFYLAKISRNKPSI